MNEHDRNIRKILTAFTEAAAPELRAALHGVETNKERFNREFERQMEARGVAIDEDSDRHQNGN